MEWHEKVLCARTKLNISQTELAKQLGVFNVMVSRWENQRMKSTNKQELAFIFFARTMPSNSPISNKKDL